MATNKNNDRGFTCDVQGCGKVCKTEGQMRLHKQYKHPEQTGNKGNETLSKTVCPDCGANNWRLLNSSIAQEKKFKDAGYTKVCKSCQEVF